MSTTITIHLTRGTENIDLLEPDWAPVKRLAALFEATVVEGSLLGTCEGVFSSALQACEKRQWSKLSGDRVKDDLTRLSAYCGSSLIGTAIPLSEKDKKDCWVKEMVERQIDIHSMDAQKNTALHIAEKEGSVHLKEDNTPPGGIANILCRL
jgi:hypothetical protein